MPGIGGREVSWWRAVEMHLAALVTPTTERGLERQVERIRVVMRAFYAYVLFLAFPWASAASAAWTAKALDQPKVHIDVLSVLPPAHWDSASVLGCIALIVGATLLCLDPKLRWLRILVAVAFVFTTAIQYDLKGKIEHGNHLAMWMAIGLSFLCRDAPGIPARRRFVASFFGVQVLIATLYTSAGICKIIGTFYDGPDGLTWFGAEALPTMITGNWDRSSTTLLGSFFVLHPGLSSLCQASAFVLELGALPAVFFRHLQKPWALGLIALHVMVLHTMKIHFHQSCIILVLALVASPFAPPLRSSIRAAWALLRRRTGEARVDAPVLDRSRAARWARFWGPGAAGLYLLVAFSRFQPSQGAFEPEVYPVSPMAMFFRLHPSEEKLEAVRKLRTRLERDGLFPERAKRYRAKKAKRRAR